MHRWLLFLGLWGLALGWMNTTYSHQRTALARWSMRASSAWLNVTRDLTDWSQLSESNRLIMLENARLRAELERLKNRPSGAWLAQSGKVLRSPGWNGSPWMVVDQGGRDGVVPGVGVLSMGFAAGKVVDTTAYESLVLSLSHPEAQWSVRLGVDGQAGRLLAKPGDVRTALLQDISKAQLVLPGDTVVTTGFDGVFPPDVPVGTVLDVISTDADEFQTLLIELGADYLQSRHVVWIQNQRETRVDSLSNLGMTTL